MRTSENRHPAVCMLSASYLGMADVRMAKEMRSLAGHGFSVSAVVAQPNTRPMEQVRVQPIKATRGRFSRYAVQPFRVLRRALRVPADAYRFCGPELICCGIVLRALGRRVVFEMIEDYRGQLPAKRWLLLPLRGRLALQWLYGAVENACARSVSGLIVAGAELDGRMRPVARDTLLLENFPSMLDFPLPLEKRPTGGRPIRIIFAGGIRHESAVRQFVSALDLLSPTLDIEVSLVGGILSPALMEEVQALPGWRRVRYLGSIPQQALRELMWSATAAVVLYTPEPNHYDVRSNRLYEAMACSLPVVVSDFPRWRHLVQESVACGVAVSPSDPESIAAGLNSLIADPQQAQELGRRGRAAFVERFNWERQEEKLIAFYRRMTADGAVAKTACDGCDLLA